MSGARRAKRQANFFSPARAGAWRSNKALNFAVKSNFVDQDSREEGKNIEHEEREIPTRQTPRLG